MAQEGLGNASEVESSGPSSTSGSVDEQTPLFSSPFSPGSLFNSASQTTPSSPWVKSSTNFGKRRTLGVAAVAFITYFNVSGGPWGSEEFVSDAGPLPGFVGLIVFPLVWGLPLALVTAELSSAFPDDGGYSLWVGEAFGEFWAFQESYWSWGSGVIDNALYPNLVFQISMNIFGTKDNAEWLGDPFNRYLCKLALAIVFTIPNIFSVLYMGKFMKWFALFVIAPFFVFAAMCVPHAVVERIWEPPPGGYPTTLDGGWLDLISVLYWNFSGFDCASTFAGEVKNPGRTYPLALVFALFMTILSYALPLLLGVMATDPSTVTNWGNDPGECSFSCIVESIGGHWLSVWILLSSLFGNMAMYIAEMFEDSWQLYGMSESGMLPSFVGYRHPKYNTPLNAIGINFVLIAGLVYFDFSDNLAINKFFSCASAMLEMVAFLSLRTSQPGLKRPYKIPFGTLGSFLFLVTPLLLGSLVLYSGCMNSWLSFWMNMGGLVFGVALYGLLKRFFGMKYIYNPKRARLLSEQDNRAEADLLTEQLLPSVEKGGPSN